MKVGLKGIVETVKKGKIIKILYTYRYISITHNLLFI